MTLNSQLSGDLRRDSNRKSLFPKYLPHKYFHQYIFIYFISPWRCICKEIHKILGSNIDRRFLLSWQPIKSNSGVSASAKLRNLNSVEIWLVLSANGALVTRVTDVTSIIIIIGRRKSTQHCSLYLCRYLCLSDSSNVFAQITCSRLGSGPKPRPAIC